MTSSIQSGPARQRTYGPALTVRSHRLAAIGGRFVVLDYASNVEAFAALHSPLVANYALEARAAEAPAPALADARDFLACTVASAPLLLGATTDSVSRKSPLARLAWRAGAVTGSSLGARSAHADARRLIESSLCWRAEEEISQTCPPPRWRAMRRDQRRQCGASAVNPPQEVGALLARQALLVRVDAIRDRDFAQQVLELLRVRPGLPVRLGGLLGTGGRDGLPGELLGSRSTSRASESDSFSTWPSSLTA